MRLISRRLLVSMPVLLAWLALMVSPVRAGDVDFPAPDMAVNEFGVTTYLDLARHFVPDIAASDSGYVGRKRIPLRHIGGRAFDNGDADTFGFYDIATLRMKAEGKDRLLVLFDFAQAAKTAQGVAVLALYDATKEVRLLDAADIGFDQSTYFFDQALLPVANDSDVVLTMSTHFNSSQAYTTQSMIMVRNDRLELIDTASLFNDRLCTVERQQTIRYAANPAAAKPYAPITVTVTEIATPTDADCGAEPVPPTGKRDIRVTYGWDALAGRYVRNSDALEKLAKANEERF